MVAFLQKRRILWAGLALIIALSALHWLVPAPSPVGPNASSVAAAPTNQTTPDSLDPSGADNASVPAGAKAIQPQESRAPTGAYALTARRIRVRPEGTRRITDIQYDYPFLHAEGVSGVRVLDIAAGRLAVRGAEVDDRIIILPELDSYCSWLFMATDPHAAGAKRIEDVEYRGRGCTVWELPAKDAGPSTGNATDDAMNCPDPGGVRITICDDVPLPVRVVFPGGVVEYLESIRLLPAGSLRQQIAH